MITKKTPKSNLRLSLSALMSLMLSMLLLFVSWPSIGQSEAFADNYDNLPLYDENHVYSGDDYFTQDGDYQYDQGYYCSKSDSYHYPASTTIVPGNDPVNINWIVNETLDMPYRDYGSNSRILFNNAEVIPSDFATVEKYILGGTSYLKITSTGKVGDAELYLEGAWEDGCKLKKIVDIHSVPYPFDIKSEYTIKRGGDQVVIKYTGEKEGKLEISGDLPSYLKATYSDNDSVLTLEAIDDLPTW